MLLRLFALMNRSLRTEVRQLPGHLLRFTIAAYLMLTLLVSMASQARQGAAGREFFRVIVYLNLVVLMGAAVFYFATSLTEEKEEQTIGLLRMANVGPATLIFGKAVPRLVWVLLLLTIQFPFTILGVTLGGVTGTQVTASYWTLFSHVLFIAGLGTFASSYCRRSGGACVLTLSALIVFYFGPAVVGSVIGGWSSAGSLSGGAAASAREWVQWWYDASAFAQAQAIFTTNFAGPIFSWQVVSNILMSTLLFLAAGVFFDWFNSDLDTAVARRPMGEWLTWKKRRPRVWDNSLAWKDFYFVAGGPSGVVLKLAIYAVVVLGIAILAENGRYDQLTFQTVALTSLWSGLIVVFVEGAFLASKIYRSELVDQTWSSLLMVPVSVARISAPKVAGCLLALIPAVALIVLAPLISPDMIGTALSTPAGAASVLIVGVSVLCVFAVFVTFTAMFSLEMSPWLAIPLAAFTVFTAWPILGCCLFAPLSGMRGGPDYVGAMTLAGGLSLLMLLATGAGVVQLHKSIVARLERLGA